MMSGKLCHALLAAKVPPEQAMEAAEEAARCDDGLKEFKLGFADLKLRFPQLEGKVDPLQWMTGTVGFGVLLPIARSFV